MLERMDWPSPRCWTQAADRVVRAGDWVFLVTNNDLSLLVGLGLEILPATSHLPSSHDDQVSFRHTGSGTQ